MGAIRILLDSNSYFRLARSVRPLLNNEFGISKRYCLYVIREMESEFRKNPRLQRKFHWVSDSEHVENRSRAIRIGKAEKRSLTQARDFIGNHARVEGLGVSRIDIAALATAYALGVQLVTDDKELLALAQDFNIATLTTLELLKFMLDEDAVDMSLVQSTVGYWQYDKDLPSDFRNEFLRLFGQLPSEQ